MSDIEPATSKARDDVQATFDAIHDKFNVPKRLDQLKSRVTRSYKDDAQPWLVAGAATVLVIGGSIAWSIIAGRSRR
jgi:hypothetical protein